MKERKKRETKKGTKLIIIYELMRFLIDDIFMMRNC